MAELLHVHECWCGSWVVCYTDAAASEFVRIGLDLQIDPEPWYRALDEVLLEHAEDCELAAVAVEIVTGYEFQGDVLLGRTG